MVLQFWKVGGIWAHWISWLCDLYKWDMPMYWHLVTRMWLYNHALLLLLFLLLLEEEEEEEDYYLFLIWVQHSMVINHTEVCVL